MPREKLFIFIQSKIPGQPEKILEVIDHHRKTFDTDYLARLSVFSGSGLIRVWPAFGLFRRAAPRLLKQTVLAMLTMFVFVTAIATGLWWWTRKERATLPNRTNPSELKAALDALTLSVARMAGAKHIDPETSWHLILLASFSSLVFKAAIVAALGHRRLLAWWGFCMPRCSQEER